MKVKWIKEYEGCGYGKVDDPDSPYDGMFIHICCASGCNPEDREYYIEVLTPISGWETIYEHLGGYNTAKLHIKHAM